MILKILQTSQLRSLERHEKLQKSMIKLVIENQKEILEKVIDPKEQTKRSNVIKLWQGKLNKLDERIDEKKRKIESSKNFTSEAEDVAAAFIEIS